MRSLFEEAEDSQAQLASYIDTGRVLVARRGSEAVGHLQLVPTGDAVELKNMAVVPHLRGEGIGRLLVKTAVDACAAEGASRIVVATAAADTGTLRFYQRCGFRFASIEHDAFTPATGYPDPIVIDGIPLLDRVGCPGNCARRWTHGERRPRRGHPVGLARLRPLADRRRFAALLAEGSRGR